MFLFPQLDAFLQSSAPVIPPRPPHILDAQMLLDWHERQQQMLFDLLIPYLHMSQPMVQNTPFEPAHKTLYTYLEHAHRARLQAARQGMELLVKFEYISMNESKRLLDQMWDQMQVLLQQYRAHLDPSPRV